MERIVKRIQYLPHRNITAKQYRSIKELASNDKVTVTRSDKGGEVVILPTTRMHRLNMDHLEDTSTYQRLQKDPTQTLRLRINKMLRSILERRSFSGSIIRRLQTPPSARAQKFYTLPKTHKETLKIRPIVSGRNGIFERLGWFLQFILKPLLKHVQAHISNTAELIKRFTESPRSTLKGMIPVSFDVVSLYTNVDVEEAIITTLEYITKYEPYLYGLTVEDINELLHLLLENNVFEYPENGFFKQIRGLAMGSRLSGTLAILAMDRFERLYIYRPIPPKIYSRYVDDIGTIMENSAQAQKMLKHLNSKHGSIKFELELPLEDGYLPILDTAVKINADGSVAYRLHTKPASKHITLHHDAHQPDSVKTAMIYNEVNRAMQNSSIENRENALETVIKKLVNNGYPNNSIQRAIRRPHRPKINNDQQRITFRLPFINNRLNTEVRRALQRHNINARIVHPRPRTLLQLAQPKPQPYECKLRSCPIKHLRCTARFVVYELTCQLCKDTYIGSTTRALHDRAKEHITAAKTHNRSLAIGEHYFTFHRAKEPQLQFRIIRFTEKDELRLRIHEATIIQRLAPAMNRRKEETGVGFLA